MRRYRALGRAGGWKAYIFLMLLCISGFIGFYRYLPGSSNIYSNDYYYIAAFIVTIAFLLGRALRRGKISIKGIFVKQGMLLVILMVVEIISTYLIIHQPILLTLKEAFYYIVPVFAYVTLLQYKEIDDEDFIDSIFEMIVTFSLICSTVATIAFLLHTNAGLNILRLDITADSFRNGTLRFNVGGIVIYLGVFVSITKLLEKEYSGKHFINLLVCAYQIIFIDKTRTVMLYIVVIIAISMLSERKLKRWVKIILWLIIVASIVGVFFSSDTVSSSLTSYLYSDAGFLMRLRAVEHYMNQFAQYPLLGIGLISSSKDITGWQLLYGTDGMYFRGDVGAIGLLNEFGIAGLLWVICFFSHSFRSLKNSHDFHAQVTKILLWFLLIGMINLSFMDNNRCMYIFFVYMFIECISRQKRLHNKSEE